MKKFKQVNIVYTIIFLVFVVYLISNIIKFINIHEVNGYDYGIKSIYSTISVYGVFKILPIFLIPAIAVFYRNKLSWMIILVYLYFFIWQIVSYTLYVSPFDDFISIYTVLVLIVILTILFFSIYIMNKAHTISNVYSLDNKKIMLYNLMTCIIGCGISILLAISNNSRYYEGL